MSYSIVDDAIRLIVKVEKGALMAKNRHQERVSNHPNTPGRPIHSRHEMARTILDFALPFGLRSAACIFNTLADLFVWALQNNYYVEDLLHYLDDFFALGPTGSDVCAESLKSIQRASTDSAIPSAPEKCEGPSTCLVFLGVELDSIQMSARLPQDKLDDLTLIIRKWATKKWRTRNSLESLVSRLNHAQLSRRPWPHFLCAA